MFLHLYGISDSRFRSLKQQYEIHGIAPRVHGNTNKLPSNTLSQSVIEDIMSFISNYVEGNVILLPSRIPGYKKDDIKLLSSSETKANIWRTYNASCESAKKTAVCYSTFLDLWKQLFPNVIVAKPMTDLCALCQQNTAKLQRSVNLPDEEKSAGIKSQQDHLAQAKAEREGYRKVCEDAEETFNSVTAF